MSRYHLSRQEYLQAWYAGHGGADLHRSWLVRTWLVLVHAVAQSPARAGVPPDAVTLAAGALAAGVVWAAHGGGRWLILAAVLVGVSGLLDSMDGALALITGRTSRWGALLDSVVDRVADACLLLALALAGAPVWSCLISWLLLVMLEYSRVRASTLGAGSVGVITVGERPTRMIVVGMFLLAAGVRPAAAATWASLGSYVLVAVGAVAVVQLLVVLHRRLRPGAGSSS